MPDFKIICIVQARSGSSRLKGKVFLDLAGKPILLRVLDRILKSKRINQIIVATTIKKEDDKIVELVKDYHPKIAFFRGSEKDVLERFYKASVKFKADVIVRITGDCPLIDSEIIDKVIGSYNKNTDYASNIFKKRTYPRGLDVEIFSFKTLEKMQKEAKNKEDREHVTLYLRKNPELFSYKNVIGKKDYSFYRWTVDQEEDYNLVKIIYRELYSKNPDFRMKDIIKLFNNNPELIKINQHVEQKNSQF